MTKTQFISSPLLLVTLMFIFASCSFNKMFLIPDKITQTSLKFASASSADTTIIFFTDDKHQPVFTKNGKDTIDLSYTIESVVFESANGNKLNGWFLKPKNATPSITLIHFHGNAGCLVSQLNAISPLLKNGFQIFMFDYSGFGFSEGEATRKNVLIDGQSALDYVKTRQDVKDTKLVIYGQSLGGHLSAVVGALRQNDIDGLVIEAAFSSHQDIAAEMAGFLGRVFVKEGYSAAESIKEFQKPLLVIHSSEDKLIPISMGQKIFDNANTPKEFYEIKKGHILAPKYYADEISNKIKNMLTQ